MRGSITEADLAFLPWDLPLEHWPDGDTVALPRGISRHVVRFVRAGSDIVAVKECEARYADREYDLLVELRRRGIPSVEPVGVVTDRADATGDPLPAALVTRHLEFSLPYRAVFSGSLRAATASRLLDALALLLVELHLTGFAWHDCSLSNTLFRRDAGRFAAYLVDAETGELHERLSDGQREHDLESARINVTGELMDLRAGARLPERIDPVEAANEVVDRYRRLWERVTQPVVITRDDRHAMERHMRELNELGFDVAEVRVESLADGERVLLEPKVVDAGHHARRLMRLTGIDAEEHQARRMLNDLDSYRVKLGLPSGDEEVAAHRWVADRFELVANAVPPELRSKLEPSEAFHEVLEHRWYLGERAGRSVPLADAVADYVATVLARKPDERAIVAAVPGDPGDDTAALRITFPEGITFPEHRDVPDAAAR